MIFVSSRFEELDKSNKENNAIIVLFSKSYFLNIAKNFS